MSSTQWFTRSMPTVSCLFMAKAIFNFVPTPSMLATSTGSRIPGKPARNNPPNPPIFPSTCAPCVCLTNVPILRFSLFAKSTSTPARAYAFFTIIRCKATAPVANSFRQAKCLPYNSFEVGKQRGLRFLIGKRFGALLSAFHDELIQCRINGEGIVAVETSKTKTVQRSAGRANHSLHVEIAETVHTKIFADIFHRHLVRDQFFRVWEIDPIVTGKPVGRTTDAHVHFFCTGLAQVHHARPRGGAAHDRVVHNDHAFSGNHFLDQIQFHPHVEIANELARLQKCAADVVVSNERVPERNL